MPNKEVLGMLVPLRPALLRFLASRGAAAHEADDILQEVYLTLSTAKIGPVTEPRAYLYRTANSHFLDHRRAAGRRVRREEDWVNAHTGEDRELDEQPSAETSLIANQQVAILQHVLDGLPERTRTIFRRFRVEGEPQRQIAAGIGVSVSAVEKHLTRAYEAIAAARLHLDEDHSMPRRLRHERGHHGD